jgi:hypothetical protein
VVAIGTTVWVMQSKSPDKSSEKKTAQVEATPEKRKPIKDGVKKREEPVTPEAPEPPKRGTIPDPPKPDPKEEPIVVSPPDSPKKRALKPTTNTPTGCGAADKTWKRIGSPRFSIRGASVLPMQRALGQWLRERGASRLSQVIGRPIHSFPRCTKKRVYDIHRYWISCRVVGTKSRPSVDLQFLNRKLMGVYLRFSKSASVGVEQDLQADYGHGLSGTDYDGPRFRQWTDDGLALVHRGRGAYALLIANKDAYSALRRCFHDGNGGKAVRLNRTGYINLRHPPNYSASTSALNQATSMFPEYGHAWVNLCRAHYFSGDLSRARTTCTRARSVTGDDEVRAEAEYLEACLILAQDQSHSAKRRAARRYKASRRAKGTWFNSKAKYRYRVLTKDCYWQGIERAGKECKRHQRNGEHGRADRTAREFGYNDCSSLDEAECVD